MQKEINLKALIEVIKKRWLIMIIMTSIMAIAGGVYSYLTPESPPIYQSSTSVLINSNESGSVNTFEDVLRDPTVLIAVIEEQGLNKTPEQLNNQITFAGEGAMVKIIVQDNSPEAAAVIANSIANIFTKQVGSLLGIYDTRIVSEAQISNTPLLGSGEESSLFKYIVFGLVGGLVIGIGMVLFLDSLDDSIRAEREIEQLLDLPVIGSVSKMTNKNTINKPGQSLKKKR